MQFEVHIMRKHSFLRNPYLVKKTLSLDGIRASSQKLFVFHYISLAVVVLKVHQIEAIEEQIILFLCSVINSWQVKFSDERH